MCYARPSEQFEQHIAIFWLKTTVYSSDVISSFNVFQNNYQKMLLGIIFEFRMINKAIEEGGNELFHPYFIFRTNYLEGNRFGKFFSFMMS